MTALVALFLRLSDFDHQLRVVEEMEPLGVLAASIAHDANNLLMVVLAALSELGQRATPRGVEARSIEAAEGATRRVAG